MADELTKTPMLDELEKGKWPSFVKEIKVAAKKSPMCKDLLGQLEQSYNEKIGHWKHGGIVGVMGYGGGVIGPSHRWRDTFVLRSDIERRGQDDLDAVRCRRVLQLLQGRCEPDRQPAGTALPPAVDGQHPVAGRHEGSATQPSCGPLGGEPVLATGQVELAPHPGRWLVAGCAQRAGAQREV